MAYLLEVKDLTTEFTSDFGKQVPVDHVSFHIKEGEVLCFVGESGCGKSITSLSIMGLLENGGTVTGGSAFFDGRDLFTLTEKERNQIRGKDISMIYQDPMTSLNPSFTIGSQMVEMIRTHEKVSKKEAKERAISMLERVGLEDAKAILKKYPHMLSGGMCQRVMIAMALSCKPKLLIADEPTTALDVTIQAQIMKLLKELQKDMGMALLLITHDMGLVAEMADRVAVMYAGQIVEEASVEELFEHPVHPYTRALLNTIPTIEDGKERRLFSIPGRVPERYDTIKGCRFAHRCEYRCKECDEVQENYTFGQLENNFVSQKNISANNSERIPAVRQKGKGLTSHTAKCIVMKERRTNL